MAYIPPCHPGPAAHTSRAEHVSLSPQIHQSVNSPKIGRLEKNLNIFKRVIQPSKSKITPRNLSGNMSLSDLPTEIILHIFRDCSSISSAINLSLTCRRLYQLLRTSQKIPVLFAIAERVWGPLEDAYQILTYNSIQPIHVKRTPLLSFALLLQVSRLGRVATWFEDMYPKIKWDGPTSHLRRPLSSTESRALRRAIYRMWLFSLAFHTPDISRVLRMNASFVANRCQLLRTWSTDELVELEDTRCCMENVLANICPTNGEVFWRSGDDTWADRRRSTYRSTASSMFHDAHADATDDDIWRIPASEVRERTMAGWGDEIEQYHTLNSMLKLNPSQIVSLYEGATTKREVEEFVDQRCGGSQFWDNGETMLHTWLLVLRGRGLPVQEIREKICCGLLGIAKNDQVIGLM